jgi:hypothetical protein
MYVMGVPRVPTGGGHRERRDEHRRGPDSIDRAFLSSWRHSLAAYVVDDGGGLFLAWRT